MEALLIAIALGILSAYIAKKKGRSFIGWWIYGAAIFIVALPHALLARPIGFKKCLFCLGDIKREALVCKYCGREQPLQDKDKIDVHPAESIGFKKCLFCRGDIKQEAFVCEHCGRKQPL